MAKTTDLKTKVNEASVADFLNSVPDVQKRNDSFVIAGLMEQATHEKPKMWGSSIIGFGSYHYKYDTGREGDMPIVGFSPRKQNIALYLKGGLEQYQRFLEKLGKHSTGKGCLYIRKLSDVDMNVLAQLISASHRFAKQQG
jgi:hypothetical protein